MDGCQLCQPLAEHPAAANFLLRRVWLVQFKARCTRKFPRRFLDNNAELLAERPGIRLGQVHSGLDAQSIEVEFHFSANAPHPRNVGVAKYPVTLDGIGDVHHTAGLRLKALRSVIRELGQGLRIGNADAYRDPRASKHLGSNLPSECVKPTNAGEIGKGFVDAVYLDGGHHALDQRHNSLTHVPIQGVI